MDINQYLKERYQDQLQWYDQKAGYNKKRFIRYQSLVIVLGAVIPVGVGILGFFDYLKDYAGIFSSIVSAFIAVIAAREKLEQPMSNWYNYRNIAENLRKEQYFFAFLVGPYKGLKASEAEKLFVERIESTIASDIGRFINASKGKQEDTDAIEVISTKSDQQTTKENNEDEKDNL